MQRRHDRRHRQLGGDPGARRTADAGHRSRRAHGHSRPDRFPHPRHSRRPDLHDARCSGSACARSPRRSDRITRDSGRRPEGHAGWSWPAAGPSGSSPRTAARRRRRSPPPRPIIMFIVQLFYSRVLLTRRRLRSARNRAMTPDVAAAITVERDPAGQPTGWLTGDNARHQRALRPPAASRPSPQKVEGTRAFLPRAQSRRSHRAFSIRAVTTCPLADYQPLLRCRGVRAD